MKLKQEKQYQISELIDCSQQNEPSLELSDKILQIVRQSRRAFEQLKDNQSRIYGTSTGFGPFVENDAAPDTGQQASNLINHLGVGTGEYFRPSITRCAMVLRAISLSRGYSAIRPEPYIDYLALIESGEIPAVPKTGSVGASGDLVPMANVVLAMRGDGFFLKVTDASNVFNRIEASPLELTSRDALAIVNGVPFCCALAIHTHFYLNKLLTIAERLTAWLYASLGCSQQAVSKTLNRVKGHPEQKTAAQNIREALEQKTINAGVNRPLQEFYSIRGAPQILGAVRKQLDQARTTITEEINGVDDNPIVEAGEENNQVFHGANFMAQNLAFCTDSLNEAATQLGNLIERQLNLLLDPDHNNQLPKMLAVNPGQDSGFAGAQINATAIVSEMRNDCQSYGASSLSTNGQNQDIVPMALESGKNAFGQTDRLGKLLGILGIGLTQYDWLFESQKDVTLDNKPDWFPEVDPLDGDRPLVNDISSVSKQLTSLSSKSLKT
ncbi:MAG: aromatic amino acid ammonia-lyase [bacterium]